MPSLEQLIPEVAAFQRAQALGQQQQLGQLQQVGALQGILAKARDQQREIGLRGALSQLGQDASEEEIIKAVTPFVGGKELLTTMTASKDRQAALEANKLARRDALEARLYDIDRRSEDKALTREQTASLAKAADATRRELAAMGFQVRREIAANRQPTTVNTDQGIFERGPNGLTPLMDPNNPGKQLRPPSLVSGGNQQALALRREYNGNPEVKLANSLEPKVGPTAEYVASVGGGMGNAVGDAELVKLWLMTTHPKGDQISNLDHRQIQAMPDLWGRVKNVAGNFVFGKTLDADTRADMWRSISQKYKATAASREKVKGDITGRASRMNIDPSLIFHVPTE